MFPNMGCTMLLAIFLLATPSFGFHAFVNKIPNGNKVPHPCMPDMMWTAVGHLNPLGDGKNNLFGDDFHETRYKWTEELCRHDSDGDGKSNGEELGDPNCTWMEGGVPERVTDITHPGICDPLGEGVCAGKDTYVNCEMKTFEDSCALINNPDVTFVTYRFKEISLPATEMNYYCQVYELPTDGDYHMVANDAIVDNKDLVQHMTLYGCEDDYETSAFDESPQRCDMKRCGTILSLWSVGIGGTCFGEKMGFRIGANGYKKVKLEIHYNNHFDTPGYKDTSGMKVYYQPVKAGVEDMANFAIGQTLMAIPPGKMSTEVYGSCPGDCTKHLITKPMTVVSALSHMHYMGRKQKTEVIRNGMVVKVLADDQRYKFDEPMMHKLEEPFQVLPGDEIATTCTYSSVSRDNWVFFGDTLRDEMCFAFIFAYPADALPKSKACTSHGSLSFCDLDAGTPKYDCDWARFTNLSNPEMMKHYENLQDTCHFDGTCRPECQEMVKRIKRHPCMKPEMAPVVSNMLDTYREGSQFLGKLHSCDGAHGGNGDDMDCKRDCGHMCSSSYDSSASHDQDTSESDSKWYSESDSESDSSESHDMDGDNDWKSSAAILAPMTAAILMISFFSAAMATVVSF